MSAYRDALMQELTAGGSDLQVAERIVGRLRKADLVWIVADDVRRERRNDVRATERAGFASFVAARGHGQRPVAELVERARVGADRDRALALLRRSWRLGNGELVEIGQATLDEVRQRLAMLRSQAAGLAESIRFVEQVEAELVRTGARCLNDLVNAAAAA